MKIEEERQLLLLVLNVLMQKWDEFERRDPDQSLEKWRDYKCIRNNTRDWINEIAEIKDINLSGYHKEVK